MKLTNRKVEGVGEIGKITFYANGIVWLELESVRVNHYGNGGTIDNLEIPGEPVRRNKLNLDRNEHFYMSSSKSGLFGDKVYDLWVCCTPEIQRGVTIEGDTQNEIVDLYTFPFPVTFRYGGGEDKWVYKQWVRYELTDLGKAVQRLGDMLTLDGLEGRDMSFSKLLELYNVERKVPIEGTTFCKIVDDETIQITFEEAAELVRSEKWYRDYHTSTVERIVLKS
jgi:hypothetical protein